MLEKHHGYIQWIFPTPFKSPYNPKAEILSPDTAGHFIDKIQVARRVVKSYEMFLDFLGLKLAN